MNKNVVIKATEIKTTNLLPYDELYKIVKKCYNIEAIDRRDVELIERQIYSAENMLKNVLHAKEFRIYLLKWNSNPNVSSTCESATRRLLADPNSVNKPLVRETIYTLVSMPNKRQRYELYIDLPKIYFND